MGMLTYIARGYCLCGGVDMVLHVYKLSWSLVLTSASYRYMYIHSAYLLVYCLKLFVIVYKHVMLMVCW